MSEVLQRVAEGSWAALSTAARSLYPVLEARLRNAAGFRVSAEELIRLSGCSRATVFKRLRELEQTGLLRCTRGFGKASAYELIGGAGGSVGGEGKEVGPAERELIVAVARRARGAVAPFRTRRVRIESFRLMVGSRLVEARMSGASATEK